MKKVRITLPKAKNGMSVSGIPGSVGYRNMNNEEYTHSNNGNEEAIRMGNTLGPTDRDNATLEAERGETVTTNLTQGGIPEFYNIGGKRHYDGGTPLNLPEDSFIFSRDRKMKIYDKEILAQFGINTKKKKGFTPADISKRFNNNKYHEILADSNSDKYQIETAQKMIENYNLKLGSLAMVQESMKAFPTGIPQVAMPYLDANGIDPMSLLPQNQQPQQQQPQGFAQYGGAEEPTVQDQAMLDYMKSVGAYGDTLTYGKKPIYLDEKKYNPYQYTPEVKGRDMDRVVLDNQTFKADSVYTEPNFGNMGVAWVNGKPVVVPTVKNDSTAINFTNKYSNIHTKGKTNPQLYPAYGVKKLQKGGPNPPNDIIDRESNYAKNSMNITPLTQNVNQNQLAPGQVDAEAYPALAAYNPQYDDSGTKVTWGADDPVRIERDRRNVEIGDARKLFAKTFNLPTTDRGLPNTEEMDLNVNISKDQLAQLPEGEYDKYMDNLRWKNQMRKRQGFQQKQYYGDIEGEQQNYNADTPFEDLNFGVRFLTGAQSKQIAELKQKQLDSQVAQLTVNKYGGDSMKKLQAGGTEGDNYVTGLDDPTVGANYINQPISNQGADYVQQNVTDYGNDYIVEPVDLESLPTIDTYTSGIPAGQAVRFNKATNSYVVIDMNTGTVVGKVNPGTSPKTSVKATKYQSVPEEAVKWEMGTEGYNEADVQSGDFVKKSDGKWYKVTGHKPKVTAYNGGFSDPRLKGGDRDLQESFGRLKQRIDESPELEKAIVANYRESMGKVKPRKNLTQNDIDKANAMNDTEVMKNFYEMQKQVMSVQANVGTFKDEADKWDKDRSEYEKTITDLGFEPLEPWQQAAFQGAYIGLQNAADDPKYKDLLEDFKVVPVGKGDEPGGGTGRATISDIDGWVGNTTMQQAALYAPTATELDMKEAEWKKEVASPEIKHLQNITGYSENPYWTEDIINLAGAARNLFGIEKQPPWNAIPGTKLATPTFANPDQVTQNIGAMQNIGIQGAAAFSGPQAFAANTAQSQRQAMREVNVNIGNIQDQNVRTANQFALHNAGVMNQANMNRANLATNLHDKNAILNQQFDNAKTQAWDEVRKGLVNMHTNRGMTQATNEMYDNFRVDPRTGYVIQDATRDITPKDGNKMLISNKFNEVKRMNPGINDAVAYKIASNELGMPETPSGGFGVDPAAYTYPGGMPSGYQPE